MYYPKRPNKDLFTNLTIQCKRQFIPFLDDMPDASYVNENYNFVLDAIFGFSFRGDVRPPFDSIIDILKTVSIPLASVDIPSGEYLSRICSALGENPLRYFSMQAQWVRIKVVIITPYLGPLLSALFVLKV